jgi:hypothetical protein
MTPYIETAYPMGEFQVFVSLFFCSKEGSERIGVAGLLCREFKCLIFTTYSEWQ